MQTIERKEIIKDESRWEGEGGLVPEPEPLPAEDGENAKTLDSPKLAL